MFSYWQGGGRKKLKNMPKPTQFFMLFRCGLGLQIYPWLTPYRVSQMALVNKEPIYQRRRPKRRKCNPWVRKTPWRRAWQPISVFLPGEFHGQRRLVGYSPWGHKELDITEWLTLSLDFQPPSHGLYWFPRAAVTKYHKLIFILSQFWSLEAWYQDLR